MYLRNFSLGLFILFLISCGGGGGSDPLKITLNSITMFSTNEDTAYTGSVSATTNKPTTKNYQISGSASNGNVTVNDSGTFTYTPNPDFFGSDSFSYRAIASILDNGQASESVQATATISVTVNAVNDPPVFTIERDDTATLNTDNMILDSSLTVRVTWSDVDNNVVDLSSVVTVSGESLNSTFTNQELDQGTIDIDFTSLNQGGLKNLNICLSDLMDQTCESFQSWFVADKNVVAINYTDSSGTSQTADYNVYYVLGGPNTTNGTQYLFLGEPLTDSADLDTFRGALIDSVATILNSDAGNFIDGFFNIAVAEPVTPDGSSPAGVETGCYDWDPSVYCIGDLDLNVAEQLLPNYDLFSILTTVQGRGVNLGNRNIQWIRTGVNQTLMHELGHAHGQMGDEYLTSDDRDVSYWADLNVNTTTETDPANLKWKHWIQDLTNVPGVDHDVCYDYSDGTVFEDLTLAECECLWNKYDNSLATETDPECHKKVGLFEGNYYGAEDNYRPKYWTIMEGGILEYGEVNVEGFAWGSIVNQGFTEYVTWPTNTIQGGNTITLSVDANFNTSNIKLKWFLNGVEDSTKENQKSVTFDRPMDDSVQTYSWQAVDLTGAVIAPDDPTDPDDFYEGLMNSYYWWYSDTLGWNRQEDESDSGWNNGMPIDPSEYKYGYIEGPLGFTYSINWAQYPANNLATTPAENINTDRGLHLSSKSKALIISLDGSSDNLRMREAREDIPKRKNIRKGKLVTKKDKYIVNLLNENREVVYSIGIGNPFYAQAQHIGYEDNPVMGGPVEVKDLELSFPLGINPSFLSLEQRTLNGFKKIKEIELN